MESSDAGRGADWTPPRFELGGATDERIVPRPPPDPAARATPRPVRRRPAAARSDAARRNGVPSPNGGTLLALVFLIAAAGGLIALSALVMPQALGLLAVVLAFFVFGAVHYLLWGWWAAGTRAGLPNEEDESA